HAFAEFDIADENALVRLPDSLKGLPCPGEPLACAMNVFRRSQIEPGMTVAVVGIGFLGALLTNLAVRAGARVIAISRRPSALDFAKKAGASEIVPLEEKGKVIEQVKELTDGDLCDIAIEATGFAEPLDLAGELTKVRGRLIIAGYHQDGPREVNMQLWNWRGLDVINAHEREPARYLEGLQDAFATIARGELDPRPFLTHEFPLENIDEAFHFMRDRPDDFLKASIIFS
ncbi:MAG TPA: zinc-binding dehydrogenase, partial [Opitutales bacterium]|nr:zinc-binding dehydrogenase [Opitutales bacterium]